jgi:phage shock protein B
MEDVMGLTEAIVIGTVGSITILSLFVVLPWMILHFISKARSSSGLSEEDSRMLADLWRSAKAMERRIESLEKLLDDDAAPARPRPASSHKGEIN